jgi:hypothetical protein
MAVNKSVNDGQKHKPKNKREAPRIDLESGNWASIRREYDKKYPVFGSQIHFAIDVIRRAIRDARGK